METFENGGFKVSYKEKNPQGSYDIPNQEKPQPSQYLRSVKTDLPMYAVTALCLSMLLIFMRDPYYRSYILEPSKWSASILAVFTGVFSCCFIISIVVYPTFAYIVNKSTKGQRKAGIRFLNVNGTRASIKQILVRSFCAPFSLLFFGYVPIFFGKRSLQDTIANTIPINVSA